MSLTPALRTVLIAAASLAIGGVIGHGLGANSASAAGLDVGKKPPEFSVTDLQGQTHSLKSYRGKILVLHFWASWCPFCRQEIAELRELQAQWADKNVRVLAVSNDEDASKLKAFVQEQSLPYPIAWDREQAQPIAPLYGLQGIPLTYIISPKGRVVARLEGSSEIIAAVKRATAP